MELRADQEITACLWLTVSYQRFSDADRRVDDILFLQPLTRELVLAAWFATVLQVSEG